MEVSIVLKTWRIVQDEKTKLPKPAGKYLVMMGDKEIAAQDFNEGYTGKEIPFSGETINVIMQTEAVIKAELERMLK